MPIVLVHGVATRSAVPDRVISSLIARYIVPVISDDPNKVPVRYAFWGDRAGQLRWNGASRPRTPLLGLGASTAAGFEHAIAVASTGNLVTALPTAPAERQRSVLTSGRIEQSAGLRLNGLKAAELSDLICTNYQPPGENPGHHGPASDMPSKDIPSSNKPSNEESGLWGDILVAIDDVAHDDNLRHALHSASDIQAEWGLISDAIWARIARGNPPVHGVPRWLNRLGERVIETTRRSVGLPGFVAGRVTGELRPRMQELTGAFIGDLLAYMGSRGSLGSPGPIPHALLDTVHEAVRDSPVGQPLLVISHSMGGQVVYDLLAHFMAHDARFANITVDFWAATATQVALFQEMGLFLDDSHTRSRGPGNPVPLPPKLAYWWNVWDPHDYLSFTAKGIFAHVDDEAYHSGMSMVGAHLGYLSRPSFYRLFAQKLSTVAHERHWLRT